MPDAEQRTWARDSEVHGPNFAAVDAAGAVPRLIVIGAVALTAALCRAGRAVGWIPYVVDPRERFVSPDRFPDAEQLITDWPAGAYARLGGLDARTAVVAVTHAPELDDDALSLALSSQAFYVGALGSRRTQQNRRRRLADAGLTEAQLARLSGPAGLDLGGETVEEAALSILAEAVAALHGRDGARLTTSAHAIHAGERP
jgi:xanthine dehydrogenase accessory factor